MITEPKTEKPILGNETILIVEDEEMLVDLLSATFEDSGYSIFWLPGRVGSHLHLSKNIGKIDLIFGFRIAPLKRVGSLQPYPADRPGGARRFRQRFFEPEVRSQNDR